MHHLSKCNASSNDNFFREYSMYDDNINECVLSRYSLRVALNLSITSCSFSIGMLAHSKICSVCTFILRLILYVLCIHFWVEEIDSNISYVVLFNIYVIISFKHILVRIQWIQPFYWPVFEEVFVSINTNTSIITLQFYDWLYCRCSTTKMYCAYCLRGPFESFARRDLALWCCTELGTYVESS